MKSLVVALKALRQLKKAFDSCGIPYLIGGSVASSVRGDPRFTNDVDIVAQVTWGKIESFVDRLGADWYADADAIREAIRRQVSYNLLFTPEFQKIDVFPACEPFHFTQLKRATEVNFGEADEPLMCPVASPEDIILAKLSWYKLSAGHLERQLDDIAKVFAANPAIDRAYLNEWARELGVADLLARFVQ